jgi:thiol-disulfide isomerase/thioredoxin
MKRKQLLWLVVSLALVALLLGTFLSRLPTAAERTARSPCTLLRVEPHRPEVPPLSLTVTDLKGTPYSFAHLRGRLVLLNFWLTTCQPCLEELPSLLELASRYHNQGLVLVLVSTDKEAEAVREFMKKVPRLTRLPDNAFILHDPGAKLANRLGTEKFPETYLITPQGKWGGRVVGARDWTSRATTACLSLRLP